MFHSKRALKNILGAIALRLNHIYSVPSFFDQRCNQLEKWLLDRGYRDKLVSGQMLEARKLNGSALNFLKGSTKNIIFRLQPKLTSYLKRQGNFQLQTSSISVNRGFQIPKQGKSKVYVGSLLNYDF